MNAAKPGGSGMSMSTGKGGGAGGGAGGIGRVGGGGVGSDGKVKLTAEGRVKMGAWREDGLRGEGIQLRDWVSVLEADGQANKALQQAYSILDESTPL